MPRIIKSQQNSVLLKKTIIDLYSKYKNNSLVVDSNNIEQFHRKQLTKKVAEIIKAIKKLKTN